MRRRTEPFHVNRPNLPDPGGTAKFFAGLGDMLNRRWLTNDGKYVREFERKMEDMVGARYAIAMANGTLGLMLTLQACKRDGLTKVLVPAFTFPATVLSILWCGCEPVFCDVDEETHCLSLAETRAKWEDGVGVVMPVNVWGNCCAFHPSDLATLPETRVIYDSAHALGCKVRGIPVGNFGTAEVFSFHATKTCHAFEGGVVCTGSTELAERLRSMRNFGYPGRGHSDIETLGMNAKMSEVHALMGTCTLDNFLDFMRVNERNYQCYRDCLHDVEGVSILEYDPAVQGNYQYIVCRIAGGLENRNFVHEFLTERGVIAKRYYFPGCHKLTIFNRWYVDLPVTDRLCESVLVLPNGTDLDEDDVEWICGLVSKAVASL